MSDNIFIKFKKILKENGLVWFNRYYGFYPALCVDNEDPEGLHRIRCKCTAIWGENAPEKWISPKSIPAGEKFGVVNVPYMGQPVWIEFLEGDPSFPFYLPSHYGKQDLPDPAAANYPHIKGYYAKDGFYVQYDEKIQEVLLAHPEKIWGTVSKDEIAWNYQEKFFVRMKIDGISITDKEGNSLGAVLEEMNKEIQMIQVPTPLGTSGFPVNATKFTQIITTLKKFLL